jgi:methionine-rich copper-binding protein CopC
MMTTRAGTRRLVALFWLSAAWLMLSCAPALAHASLLQEVPADGATVTEPPERVRLAFSEAVEAEFDPIEVYDQHDERVDRDNAQVDPEDAEVVEVGLEDKLPEGSYRVQWRVTSLDGHVIDGTYRFVVGASKAEAAEAGARGAGNPEERASEGQGASPVGGVGWAMPVAVLVAITVAIVGFAALRRR